MDELTNLLEIYMPKLRHIENSGNSETIHEARRWICTIDATYTNAKYYWEHNNQEKYMEMRDYFVSYIDQAIEWMKSLV